MLFFNILIKLESSRFLSILSIDRSKLGWRSNYTQLLQVVVNGERIDGASVNEEVQVEFPQDLILRIAELNNITTS